MSKRKPRNREDNFERRPRVSKDFAEQHEQEFQVKTYNDGSWYTWNPQLVSDSGNVPFTQLLGTPTTVPTMAGTSPRYSYPGVMRITYVPGVGVSSDSTSALNVAAKNLYADIRYKNSGRKNYDAPDLMLMIFAVCNMFAMFSHLRRAYGVARRFSAVNRYMPFGILQAMGFDPNEVVTHLNELRYRLNMYAARLRTFVVPNVMSLYLRQFWLNNNVYKDADDDKAQLYVFVPDVYYVYNEKSSDAGGFCEAKHINNSAKNSLDEWYAMLDEQIEALVSSEDIGLMLGDIMKRFEHNTFSVNDVPEDYVVNPAIEMTVLSQIQNATAVGFIPDDDPDVLATFNVRNDPDTNTLIWNPTFIVESPGVAGDKLLTLPMYRNLKPLDTIECTRLTNIASEVKYNEDYGLEAVLSHSGTEVCTTFAILQYLEQGGEWQPVYWGAWNESHDEHILTDVTQNDLTDFRDAWYAIRLMCAIGTFNYHPEFRFWKGGWSVDSSGIHYTGDGNYYVDGSFVDVENYTYVNEYVLGRLHDVAVLSEFSVPLEKSGTKI